jgi:MerR family transcriptional regulator, heat shock protein HspR
MPSKTVGYSISVVSEMYEVHPQTLRTYEREGLLKPSRSSGNTRLYTPSDLQRLELILNLTRGLGVNIAGVEVILNMRDKMERMQQEVEDLIRFLSARFDLDPDFFQERMKHALVRVPPSKIVKSRGKGEKG